MATEGTEDRERDFWDHSVPSLEECLREFHQGPGPGDRAMMDRATRGKPSRVLDFACGAGVTSAWLAAEGHDVVGVELSPVSIQRARDLCAHLGLTVDFREIDLNAPLASGEQFDALIGRFALHHLDIDLYAPILADARVPGGHAAFMETMSTNPVLNLARNHLAGRGPIPKFGSDDEHPLTNRDIARVREAFGEASLEAPEYWLFRLANAYLLKWRSDRVNRWTTSLDRFLGRFRAVRPLSYHQMVVCEKRS